MGGRRRGRGEEGGGMGRGEKREGRGRGEDGGGNRKMSNKRRQRMGWRDRKRVQRRGFKR